MATSVKTAISLHEDLFREVNKIAKELQISRSKLFVLAVQDFIKKQESQKLLSKINKAFSDYPDSNEQRVGQAMKKKHMAQLGNESW